MLCDTEAARGPTATVAGSPTHAPMHNTRNQSRSMVLPRAWRTRTTSRWRLVASIATVAPLVLLGVVVLGALVSVGMAIGVLVPTIIVVWLAPTALAMGVAARASHGADPGADDVIWFRWAIERVTTGEVTLISLPARLLISGVIGAPLAWLAAMVFCVGGL